MRDIIKEWTGLYKAQKNEMYSDELSTLKKYVGVSTKLSTAEPAPSFIAPTCATDLRLFEVDGTSFWQAGPDRYD